MSMERRTGFVACMSVVLALIFQTAAASSRGGALRRLLANDSSDSNDQSSMKGYKCRVGEGCQEYCSGWHKSKQLYYITTCPLSEAESGQCMGMKCEHTSESSADTSGCYCCCGKDYVPGASFYGPTQERSPSSSSLKKPGSDVSSTHVFSKNENGCKVGSSCRDYCEGHLSKDLFFVTSCPADEKDSGRCGDLQCRHTSEGKADTDGCFCCCGSEPTPSSVYNGPTIQQDGDHAYIELPSSKSSSKACNIGPSCQDYCLGYGYKELFFVTSCPADEKKRGHCLDLQCQHSSEGRADTDGCFCCCGGKPAKASVYIGPTDKHTDRISGDEISLPPLGTAPNSLCNEVQMGSAAGEASCVQLGIACALDPASTDAPAGLEEMARQNQRQCTEPQKAVCLLNGRQYPRRASTGCARALAEGYGRCPTPVAQAIFEQSLTFLCGAVP